MPKAVRSTSRHAFTLIELMIVVAIIALLIAILLPSLHRAHQQAMAIKCLSNLSAISKAVVYYTMDPNNGNGYLPQMGRLVYSGYWANQIRRYVKIKRTRVGARDGLLLCPADAKPSYRWITPGGTAMAGEYATRQDKIRSDAELMPPSAGRARGAVALLAPWVEPVSYVGMCETLGRSQSRIHHGTQARWAEIKRPHCYLILTEMSERPCMRWPGFGDSRFDYPSLTRHYGGSNPLSNGSNFLFADGHAQWHSARYAASDMVCCVDFRADRKAKEQDTGLGDSPSIEYQRKNCTDEAIGPATRRK